MPVQRLALVGVVIGLLVAGWRLAQAPDVPVAMAAPPAVAGPLGNLVAPGPGLPTVPLSRSQLVKQYQLAAYTLCSYEQASQYPPGARPMSQNADQAYPNRPVTGAGPMRQEGGTTDSQVILRTAQSRVYMASGETVTFSLHAVDPDGATLPLVVTRAVAAAIRYGVTRPAAMVAVDFIDDGAGTLTGTLAPAQTGLATFDGTVRTQVDYAVNGKNGVVTFDVVYSPVLPAVWSGPVREARENGALNFYLPADVHVAGRYIVTGRLDDAHGVPFALLTFNDVLPAGSSEIRLSTFGKLLRDGAPALPLTLRDVDGYLLRENADPDRALMPRLEGRVATSGRYPADSFSDAPYDGEERRRYLAEFGKDVTRARAALLRNDPQAALPASDCDVPPAR